MTLTHGPGREPLRAIFFDLDNTLLDHTSAARSAMQHVHGRYGDLFAGLPFDRVFEQWVRINDIYWHDYSMGRLSATQLRTGRLHALAAWTREQHGSTSEDAWLVEEMSVCYIDRLVADSTVYDGVASMLQRLHEHYALGVISNGFADVQLGRLRSLGLDTFFDHIILSEQAGASKPDLRIFNLALESAGTTGPETLYIGDNFFYDICGASRAGLRTIWFNPSGIEPPAEPPGIRPDAVARSIAHLALLLDNPFELTSST